MKLLQLCELHYYSVSVGTELGSAKVTKWCDDCGSPCQDRMLNLIYSAEPRDEAERAEVEEF